MPKHLLSEPGDWFLGELHPLSHGNAWLEVDEADGQVRSARLDCSNSARGDEKLLEVRDVQQGLALAGRAGWLTPAAAELAYARAIEELLGLQPPPRALALRELLLDVQMVIGHSWRLAAMADLCGADGRSWLAQRELWLKAHERLTGARVHDVWVRLGGVATDASAEVLNELLELVLDPWPELDPVNARGLGHLSGSQAADFAVAGIPSTDHDAADRIRLLADSLVAARSSLAARVAQLPDGAVSQLLPKSIRVPVGSSRQQVDSATGGIELWVFGDGGKAPTRVSYSSNSDRAVALFEAAAVGMPTQSARWLLATLPIATGEVAL